MTQIYGFCSSTDDPQLQLRMFAYKYVLILLYNCFLTLLYHAYYNNINNNNKGIGQVLLSTAADGTSLPD